MPSVFSELSREGGSGRLGDLEKSPVFRSIARHMGYNLSTDALMAHNLRGIAVIVYGAPLTGKKIVFFNRKVKKLTRGAEVDFKTHLLPDKSSTAAGLAHRYGAACLSIDDVVTNAIQSGTSAISITARQKYEAATARCAQRRAAQVGKNALVWILPGQITCKPLLNPPSPSTHLTADYFAGLINLKL